MIVMVRSESYIITLHRDSLAQYRLSYDENYKLSCILYFRKIWSLSRMCHTGILHQVA